MLGVSAGKVCYPVAFFILVKACDLLFITPISHAALALSSNVHEGELWPAHCSTPTYAAHGPTASRYWCAITLEIWCRWVKS